MIKNPFLSKKQRKHGQKYDKSIALKSSSSFRVSLIKIENNGWTGLNSISSFYVY